MYKVCVVAVDIRSTHNVGSIFRTCDGFGADLILTGITPRPKSVFTDDRLPHVINKADKAINKTALGAEKTVTWNYYNNPIEAIKQLKKSNYRIYAIEQSSKSKPITEMKIKQNTALIVGPEVEGLAEGILAKCDDAFEIPMIGDKESFNVSIATAIALYQSSL